MTKVSVIMAVYNGERDLAAAIESILVQSYEDFEFLVMDDGSSDRSREILEKYAGLDDRIRVFSQPNSGLPASLNTLISKARGEYVARMDADDISYPDRFALQVAHLDSHPDHILVGGQALYCDGDGYPIFVPDQVHEHEGIVEKILSGTCVIVHPTIMTRTAVLREVGGYDTEFTAAEDLDLWLRMSEIGRLGNLPDIVIKYRLIETSISGSKGEMQAEQTRLACRRAWARRGLPERDIDDKPWRPSHDRMSREFFYLKWGWQAWQAGHQSTARRFFRKAVMVSPASVLAWKALVLGGLRPNRHVGGGGPARNRDLSDSRSG